jgi:hypothetical protein
MRYRSLLGTIVLVLSMGGACSSDEVATVPYDTTYVAPVIDYDTAAESALWYDAYYDPFTGYVVAQVVAGSDDAGSGADGSAEGGAEAGLDAGGASGKRFPRPLSGLLGAWHAVLRADCVPMVASDDNDHDGVPASYTAVFNCPNQTVGDRTSSVTGSIAISDDDDNAKNSGFKVTFTDFTVTTMVNGRFRMRTLNGTAMLMPLDGGAFESITNLTLAFDFSDQDSAHLRGTYTTMGKGTYTPDSSNDIFASGTVMFSGTATLTRMTDDASQSRTVTRQTQPQLHWNRDCRKQNPDAAGFDAGTLVYRDEQGSTVQLQFNGCGSPTVTTSG